MPRIHCLNNISKKGTDQLPENYELVYAALVKAYCLGLQF